MDQEFKKPRQSGVKTSGENDAKVVISIIRIPIINIGTRGIVFTYIY